MKQEKKKLVNKRFAKEFDKFIYKNDVGGIYKYPFKKILNIAQNQSISNKINT